MPKGGCSKCNKKPADSVWLFCQTNSSVICQSWPQNHFTGFFTGTVRAAYLSWSMFQTLQIDC